MDLAMKLRRVYGADLGCQCILCNLKKHQRNFFYLFSYIFFILLYTLYFILVLKYAEAKNTCTIQQNCIHGKQQITRHKLYSYLRAAGNFIPERWSEFKFSSHNYVEEFIEVMRFAENQITQSLNRSISQSINQSINQSISQSVNHSFNHSIDLSTVIYNELFLVSLQTLNSPYLSPVLVSSKKSTIQNVAAINKCSQGTSVLRENNCYRFLKRILYT